MCASGRGYVRNVSSTEVILITGYLFVQRVEIVLRRQGTKWGLLDRGMKMARGETVSGSCLVYRRRVMTARELSLPH